MSPVGSAPSRSATTHRAGRGRPRLWTSLAAAALGTAALVSATLAPAEPAQVAQPVVEQVHDSRRAPAAASAGAHRRPRPTTPSRSAPPAPAPAPTAPAAPPAVPSTEPGPTGGPTGTATGGATGSATGSATGTPTGTPTGTATGTAPAGTPAPAPAAAPTTAPATAGNPLAGTTFHGVNTGAAHAAAQPGRSAADAAALRELAGVPTATWLGAWSGDVAAAVRQEMAAARASGAVPVLVTYNVPGRDCGGYSAGGVGSSAAYLEWVRAVAAGIGTARAVVVVEPDALAQLCGDAAERTALLRSAVDVLESNPGTHTYLDAGHATWIDAATMAGRLRAAGVAEADGFALNVSNFETTAGNVAYGDRVSALLGGTHYVVDTSRNGNGPGTDWCNPPGRAVGERPTTQTGHARVDAYLWIKRVGESDGTCNGGPAAGTFWDAYAIGLVRGA